MNKNDFEQIKINSSLLGNILSNMKLGNCDVCHFILEDENVKAFLENDDLVKTTQAFLSNNLNICKTSKKIFMHRNTLLYRIEKIKKLLGLDIRQFDDAITMHIILTIANFNQK